MGCFQIAPVWPGGRNWQGDYIGMFILCHWKRGGMGWGGRICLHSHPRHCNIGNHSQPDNRSVCPYSTWSRLDKLCCPPRSRKTPPGPLKMAITGHLIEPHQLTDVHGSHRGKEEDKRKAKWGRPHCQGLRISVGRNFKPNLRDILGTCSDTECLNFAKWRT